MKKLPLVSGPAPVNEHTAATPEEKFTVAMAAVQKALRAADLRPSPFMDRALIMTGAAQALANGCPMEEVMQVLLEASEWAKQVRAQAQAKAQATATIVAPNGEILSQ